MSALWLVVGVLGQKMLLIFLGLGSLVILRLFGLLPLDVSLGGPSDGGTGGSVVVSVVLVELEGSWLITSILFSE